jgi:cephalosporin-C deacetylase-like acetyl esterase
MQWAPKTPSLSFDAKDLRGAKAWQKKARKAFEASLGPEVPSVPFKVKALEKVQCEGYTRQKLLINTGPGLQAVAWFCVPDGLSASRAGRRPAVVATPGHGNGAKDLVGMDRHGMPRKEGEGYQKDYALQAVRLGYPALSIEPLGFGDRRDDQMKAGKTSESGCQAAFNVSLMLGYTLARIRVNDIQKGIDFLQGVPFIDPEKIALIGISGGGQMTLWTTAVEPRIKAAVVSGYFNSFKHSVMAMHHCVCNFIPGVAQTLDMTDLGALIAPRPILVESGTLDDIFPIQATRDALAKLRKIYKVFGVPGNVEEDIFEGDHQWSGKKVEAFLEKAFK